MALNVYVCEIRNKKSGHRIGFPCVVHSGLNEAREVAYKWALTRRITLSGRRTLLGSHHAVVDGKADLDSGPLPTLEVEVNKVMVEVL